MRSDEHGGRELRIGERRAAVHADEGGTELRIEDRWASVRQEESRRDDEPGREGPRRSEARRERERDWADPGDWSSREWGRGDDDRDDRGPAADRWSESSWEEGRRNDDGSTRWSEVRRERHGIGGTPAALPAAPAEPASSWTSGWANAGREQSERLPRRSRHAHDDDDYDWNGGREDDAHTRSARRIVDFEGNDDRWR